MCTYNLILVMKMISIQNSGDIFILLISKQSLTPIWRIMPIICMMCLKFAKKAAV